MNRKFDIDDEVIIKDRQAVGVITKIVVNMVTGRTEYYVKGEMFGKTFNQKINTKNLKKFKYK